MPTPYAQWEEPHLRFYLAAVAVIALSIPLGAQTLEPIELSPFAGYFIGGTIFDYRSNFSQNLSLRNDLTYGIRVGWNATSHIEPELQWSRTSTEFSPPAYLRRQINVDYFLGGASYNFGSQATRPYVSVDLGAAQFDAINGPQDTLFTISVGVGIKHFFTPNFGLRLDARGYTSETNQHIKNSCIGFSEGSPGGPVVPDPCAHNWLLNGDVTGGVVIAF